MNICSKLVFIFGFLLFTNQTLKMNGMDSTKPLNTQSMEAGYKVSYYCPIISTRFFELYFPEYTKQVKFMNIPWFKHIYRTEEENKLNYNGESISYKQKKIVFQGYELASNPFTKFFLVGAFAAPWLYACYGK